jgi:hypothetical protein
MLREVRMDDYVGDLEVEAIEDFLNALQRVDNSDDTSEVIAAADEYFSIQQEGC